MLHELEAALTADRDTDSMEGIYRALRVAASTTVYSGSLVCSNAAGYAVPGADTAGLKFRGVAREQGANASGANGDVKVEVDDQAGKIFFFASTGLTQADVGEKLYIIDDQTVGLEGNGDVDNYVYAGTLAYFDSATSAPVRIDPVQDGGAGADSSGSAELNDPGDAGAIPATAGVCHLVTAGAETRSLADPTEVGLDLTLFFLTDGGNCVVTAASPINETGNNTITFADVTECIHLRSVRDAASAYRWQLVANVGAALTTV